MILGFNKEGVCRSGQSLVEEANGDEQHVLVVHAHDEASMRIRSVTQAVHSGDPVARVPGAARSRTKTSTSSLVVPSCPSTQSLWP